jgi:DNA-directed RNA polymerase specialized sigma24 family protein
VADGQGGGGAEVATLSRPPAQPGPDEGAGDPRARAFLDLVGWHRSQIELLCAQVTDRRDDAKEAIQRSLVVVWHRLDEGLSSPMPTMWLYRQVRNVAVQVSHARSAAAGELAAGHHAVGGHPDGAAVRAVVLRLRPEFRSALVLADAVGFDDAQVAEVEGTSTATAATLIAGARKAVAWGLAGGGPEVLGPDGMFDLGWLTTPAGPDVVAPPFDRVRAALLALSTPGLWDRTWEFYLSQAMGSTAESASAAALGPFPPPAHAVPTTAAGPRDRRRALVLVAAIVAAVVGLGAFVVSARRSDDNPASSLASANGGVGAGSDEGTPGAKPVTTRKKPNKASTSTAAGESEESADGRDTGLDGADGDLLDESDGSGLDDGTSDDEFDDGSFDDSGLDDGSFDDSDFGDDGDFSDGSFDGTDADFFNDPDSVFVEGDDPEPTTSSPSPATTVPGSSGAAPASVAPALKVLAAADASSIKLKWAGAAPGATGVRLLWTCCTPVVPATAGPMATAATYTIVGLKPSTEYRVTLEVDGVDASRNAVTVVIRTTAAGSSTTAKPPTTTTTVTPTTPTTAVTTTTAPGEYNVPGGIPAPDGPSAGGD